MAAILAVRAGLRNVEFTTSKPMSAVWQTAATALDRTKQSNAMEPAPAPLRQDVLAGPERLEAEPFAQLGDLEDPPPRARRLPAVELVEVALGQLQPDAHRSSWFSSASARAACRETRMRSQRMLTMQSSSHQNASSTLPSGSTTISGSRT